jgi:hypothetical protein
MAYVMWKSWVYSAALGLIVVSRGSHRLARRDDEKGSQHADREEEGVSMFRGRDVKSLPEVTPVTARETFAEREDTFALIA